MSVLIGIVTSNYFDVCVLNVELEVCLCVILNSGAADGPEHYVQTVCRL